MKLYGESKMRLFQIFLIFLISCISNIASSFSCKIVILDNLEIEMGATRCIDNDFLSDNPLNKKSLEFDNSPLKVDQNKLQSFHGNKPTHILFGYSR